MGDVHVQCEERRVREVQKYCQRAGTDAGVGEGEGAMLISFNPILAQATWGLGMGPGAHLPSSSKLSSGSITKR